jgi:hypothetical protein
MHLRFLTIVFIRCAFAVAVAVVQSLDISSL